MKQVRYEDMPALCEQLLIEVETMGEIVEIVRDGLPILRLQPVDQATRVEYASIRSVRIPK